MARDPDKSNSEKRRLVSVYTWLMLGWGSFALEMVFPRTGMDALFMFAAIMPAIGIVFCVIAFAMSLYGIVTCSRLRCRFLLPMALSAPPLALHAWGLLR